MGKKLASTFLKLFGIGSGIVNIHLYTPSVWHFYIHRRRHSWLSVVYVRLGRADKKWGGVRGAKPQKGTSHIAWERTCLEAVTWQNHKHTHNFKNTHSCKKELKLTKMGKTKTFKKHLLGPVTDQKSAWFVNFILLLVQNTVQMWKENNDSKNNTLAHFRP